MVEPLTKEEAEGYLEGDNFIFSYNDGWLAVQFKGKGAVLTSKNRLIAFRTSDIWSASKEVKRLLQENDYIN